MTAAPATTRNHTYQFYRLGNQDLIELFSCATGNIPPAHVSVTTEHNNTRRTASSLPDLISDVTTAPGYDSHVPWGNLKFEAKDPNGELEIRIDITPARIKVEVTGTNAILVYGQQARVELFLLNRGAKEEGRSRRPELMLGIATAAVYSNPAPLSPYLATVMAVTFVIMLYSGRTKLRILENVPRGSTWSRFTPIEKVTVVGVYIAALGAVGALASGFTDVVDALKK
ncbi:hypothetical protein ABZ696_29555 [Streptomyces albidoflavus]|uniref:hypothetical protein n=1 Tax=Streptomyces albidoflavus TaxID=1886 RepID=UPI0033F6CC2B